MNFQYKELSDLAFKYHSNNNFEKAEELYNKLLEINPADVNILNLSGLLCLAVNRYTEAINYLSKAFILKKTSYIASNLAKAYYMNSEYKKAIKIYNQALELGETDDIYYSLALAYKQLGDYDAVIECYKKAIQLNPQNYNALYNLSIAYKEKKDTSKAILYAGKCLEINSRDEDVYALLSGYYEDIKDYISAINALNNAVSLNNKNYLYYYNLGVLYSRIEKNKEAENAYIKSVELNSSHFESYVNLASLYKGKDNEKALFYLQKAYNINRCEENLLLSLAQTLRDLYRNQESDKILNEILEKNINSAEAYSLLGINRMDSGEYLKALDYYNKAMEINPDNYNYLHGKAIALKYLGKTEEAKELLEYIVENDKTALQSAITLGMLYLTNKEFEKGMKLYCKRSNDSKFSEIFKNRIWSYPESIDNKDILVYTDCGLGDTVMYSRFLPLLKKKAKTVTLQTDKDLISVLKNSFKDINIIQKGTAPPFYDTVISIMDLQYALKIDFNGINSKPYIIADRKKIHETANIAEIKDKKNKIGLFWQGNKRIFKNRSVGFGYIEILLKNENCNFYSFQIDEDIEEKENLYSLKKYIKDYADTAALLKNMDMLITIDSSAAHMAGALGVKTFLLLPYTAEWRWFNDTENTIWYSNTRIIKQSEPNNWEEVIKKIDTELKKL